MGIFASCKLWVAFKWLSEIILLRINSALRSSQGIKALSVLQATKGSRSGRAPVFVFSSFPFKFYFPRGSDDVTDARLAFCFSASLLFPFCGLVCSNAELALLGFSRS